jgi:DNA replication protein DnaC
VSGQGEDVLVGPCTGCGTEVTRDLTDAGWMRKFLTSAPLVCPACIASHEQAEQELDREHERAEAARRRDARIRNSGIPGQLLRVTFDDIDIEGRQQALAAARRWAAGDLLGLTLTGPVGRGKTRLAAAAANALVARRSLRWRSTPVLFAQLAHAYGHDDRESAIDTMIGSGHALVLDDLDKARPTEYGAEQIFAAIETRITEGVPLLVTTNLASDQLAAKFPDPFGEAITSRLVGHTEGYVIDYGPDRRTSPIHDQGEDRRVDYR